MNNEHRSTNYKYKEGDRKRVIVNGEPMDAVYSERCNGWFAEKPRFPDFEIIGNENEPKPEYISFTGEESDIEFLVKLQKVWKQAVTSRGTDATKLQMLSGAFNAVDHRLDEMKEDWE